MVNNSEEYVANRIAEKSDGRYRYMSGYTIKENPVIIQCVYCGATREVTYHNIVTGKKVGRCPACVARAREIKRGQALIDKALRIRAKNEKRQCQAEEQARRKAERETPHCCPVCGELTTKPIYCSVACRNKAQNKRHDQRRGDRIKAVLVDNDITVEGLFKRDKGVCWLCGKRCDFEDYVTRDGAFIAGDWYPSIDHVIPLSKGGEHSWDNVRLAHRHCNTLKRDIIVDISTETTPL